MIAGVSIFETIHHEINDARETGYKRIVHIRVTTDALPGSVTSVPVTPERARALGRLLMVRDEQNRAPGVVADPMDYERMLEILMHPRDYYELLKDAEATRTGAVEVGEITRVMGIPVSR